MGEIRVTVRLTNGADQTLVLRGQLAADQVRSVEVEALIDTGAASSAIPATLKEELGLVTVGQSPAEYADGRRETVDVTDSITFELMGRRTGDEALVLGNEVLIGQTVLEKMDLWADCRRQQLVPGHPDGPVLKVK